jgi:asparagine synthetase B (glutamine-hydrolysing)
MLSVTISIPRDDATPETPTRPYVHEITRNGVHISATVKPQYSFYAEFGDTIVVGESLTHMTSSRLAQLEQLVSKPFTCESSGDDLLLGVVIIDTRRKEVTITNDRTGERPYFFTVRPESISISTVVTDLRTATTPFAVDESRIPELLVYRLVLPPNTLIKGVRRIVSGQTLTFDLRSGSQIREASASFPEAAEDSGQEIASYIEAIDHSLTSVTREILLSYKRPMVLLSGGNDSSLLACIALRVDSRVRSCSTSFSFVDTEDMEENYAQTAADAIGIHHSIYRPSAEDYLAGVIESIAAAEEPVNHLQSVLLYLISKNYASQHADVLLNGNLADAMFGADIQLACWKHRRAIAVLRSLGISAPLRKLYRLSGMHDRRLHFLTGDFQQKATSSRHLLWGVGQYGDITTVKELFGGTDESILGPRISMMAHYERHSVSDKVTILGILTLTPIWSRMAEAGGNANAFPFGKGRVIESVLPIPWSAKVSEPKRIVRDLLRRYDFPEAMISRPKQSFGFPFKFWSLPNTLFQPLVDMAADTFDRALLSQLQSGEPRHAMILWSVLNFHFWKQIVIDQKSPGDLAAEAVSRYRTLPRSR